MTTLTQPTSTRTVTPSFRRRHIFGWRLLGALAAALILGMALYFLLLWPWISRWGATNEEVQLSLPGDELIPNPALVTTKAITVQARPEAIWPWLVQLGVDRGGMYSYLWVENWLLRLNVENSDEIRSEWQTLQVGDFIRFTPKDFALNPGPGLYVLEIEPTHALAGCFGIENEPANCNAGATWQFVLEPQADNTTRLLLRSRNSGPPSAGASFGGKLAYAFQFYMERKMLLGIKQRAERLTMYPILPLAGSVER